jgi:hypothetical protein
MSPITSSTEKYSPEKRPGQPQTPAKNFPIMIKVPSVMPNLTPLKVIGHGTFGKYPNFLNSLLGYVFEAYDNNKKIKVALKRTQKAGSMVSREYEVLSLLKGAPNVIQMHEFFYSMDHK